MWLVLAVLVVAALVICSRPLPQPGRHRAGRSLRRSESGAELSSATDREPTV
jgi:hypothetical protein